MPVHDLVLVIPFPLLIKVASDRRPYSKLGGTTLNRREEGAQYYISQTCDQERFAAKKVAFSWECLNIFATGFSRFSFRPNFLQLLKSRKKLMKTRSTRSKRGNQYLCDDRETND